MQGAFRMHSWLAEAQIIWDISECPFLFVCLHWQKPIFNYSFYVRADNGMKGAFTLDSFKAQLHRVLDQLI